MASLTHTVGGDSNLVSFKSAARVPIESLKVHFSPIQEGEGDPSPDNVRAISGWDSCIGYRAGKNIAQVTGYNATNSRNADEHNTLVNNYGTTINTTNYNLPDTSLIITQTQAPNETLPSSYNNGYFGIMVKNLIYDQSYDVSFKVTNITNNLLNCDLNEIKLLVPQGGSYTLSKIIDNTLIYKNVKWRRYSQDPSNGNYNRSNFEIRNCGISFTLSEFMVTPTGMNDGVFEPYCGEILPVNFPVLGKNKLNPNGDWKVSGYRYMYISELANNCIMSFTLKDSNIDLSGINIGFSYYEPINSRETSKGYRWCINSGEIKTYELVNTVREGTDSGVKNKICQYVMIYPKTEEAFNKLFSAYDIQIEYGNTATAYEPYNPNNTVYGGYVDLAKGELVATHKKIHTDSNDTWTLTFYENAENHRAYSERYLDAFVPKTRNILISDKFSEATQSYPPLLNTCTMNENRRILLGVPKEIKNDEDFSTWFNNLGGADFIYQLAEPIHYPLTPTQFTTFLNQNNFWSNTNDVTEVSYAIHDSEPMRVARKRILAAAPKIEEAEGGLVTFNTDISAPLKECKAYFEPKQDLHGYDKPWVGGAGKNLWNNENIIYGTWTASNGTVSAVEPGCRTQDIIASAGNTYTIFYNGERPYSVSIVELDENKNFILRTHKQWSGASSPSALTVTMSNDTKYFYAQVYNIDTSAVITPGILATYKIQLEKGSAATAYEPYENICPITGWADLEVTKCGKNLYDQVSYPLIQGYWVGWGSRTSGGESDKYACVGTTRSPDQPQPVYPVSHLGGATVTLNKCPGGKNPGFNFEDVDGSYITGTIEEYGNNNATAGTPWTITLPENAVGMRFTTVSNDAEIQLELGSTATDYEPYQGQTIPITFPSDAGTIYGGYVDLIKGELVQEWIQVKINSLSWSYMTSGECFRSSVPMERKGYKEISPVRSSIYKTIDVDGTISLWINKEDHSISEHIGYQGTTPVQSIHIKDSRYTTVNDFLNGVGNEDIVYKLQTPIEYDITPQTLKTLRGTNNIWSNSNGDITVQFWTH